MSTNQLIQNPLMFYMFVETLRQAQKLGLAYQPAYKEQNFGVTERILTSPLSQQENKALNMDNKVMLSADYIESQAQREDLLATFNPEIHLSQESSGDHFNSAPVIAGFEAALP